MGRAQRKSTATAGNTERRFTSILGEGRGLSADAEAAAAPAVEYKDFVPQRPSDYAASCDGCGLKIYVNMMGMGTCPRCKLRRNPMASK